MSTTVENVVAKTPDVEIDPKSAAEKVTNGAAKEGSHENGTKATAGAEEEAKQENVQEQVVKKEVPLQLEPKSGVSFAVELDDGKQLFAAGLRKKSMFGVGIKVYGFGTILWTFVLIFSLSLTVCTCIVTLRCPNCRDVY